MPAVAASSRQAASAVIHPLGRHVAVGGTDLWIEEEGAGEPVLLLAGGPASSHVVFHPVFGALAESHRIIYLDYRGRGRSEPVEDPRTITFAGDVADVAGLVRALGLGPVNIYGFSYGVWLRRRSRSTIRSW
jgi:pimeloyl-ACP methyl ester carboxylesterase